MTQRQIQWFLLAALACVAAAAWIVSSRRHSKPIEAIIAESSSTPTTEPAPLSPVNGLAEGRVAVRNQESAAESAHSESVVPSANDAAIQRTSPICTVHIVFIDDTGAEQRSAHGQFMLTRWHDDAGDNVTAGFKDGSWSSTFAPGELWSFDEIAVEEHLAIADRDPSERLDPSKGAIELRVHASPTTLVRVIDAASGIDLDDVDICWSKNWDGRTSMLPPPSASKVASNARSPVPVKPSPGNDWSDADCMWAGAAGYGWKRFEVTPHSGGHYLVELVPGGSVEVDVSGLDPQRSHVLRITAVKGVLGEIDFPFDEDGSTSFESIPEGRYRATIEVANSFRDPVVLASADFEVLARVVARVTLRARQLTPTVKAQLSGTLMIPAEWEPHQPTLVLGLVSPTSSGDSPVTTVKSMEQDFVRTNTWNWDAGIVETGRYEISLINPHYTFVVELDPLGKRDVALQVPPPVEVSVRLVDDRSGSPANIEKMFWHPRWPEQRDFVLRMPAELNKETGAFTIRAPSGSIVVSWSNELFEAGESNIDATPGRSEHTLRAHRATTAFFDLSDGDRVVQPEYWVIERGSAVFNAKGKGGWMTSPTGIALRFTGGGKYVVTLPDIPGFERVPVFDVDIAEGQAIHYPIRLVPKQ